MTPPAQRDADTGKRRIFLVDDHPIVIDGLTQLIQQQPDLVVCGGATDSQSAMKAVAAAKPELAIVDISLKEGSGLELIKNFRQRFPKLLILVLSMHSESLYAERALRAGARGYITKQEATQNLIAAIRRVLAGTLYLSDEMNSKLLSQLIQTRGGGSGSTIDRLSDRELEVFHLIGQGHGSREIAEKLHLSIKTVESHREKIKEKLQLQNATELVRQAVHWVQGEGTPPLPRKSGS